MHRLFDVAGETLLGLPTVLASLLVLAHGLLCARLLGVRRPLLWLVSAVPVTVGSLVLTAQLLGVVHVPSTPAADLLVSLLLCAVYAAAVRLLRVSGGLISLLGMQRDTRGHDAHDAVDEPSGHAFLGGLIGGLLGMAAWLGGIAGTKLPPQGNDDIWHGFLTARLGDLHRITTGTVAPVLADKADPTVVYPYGVHLLAAALQEATWLDVPQSLNAVWVLVAGILLPFGTAALAAALVPSRPWVALLAGVLAPTVTAFPYLLNGVMPYALTLAMIPGFLALLHAFVRRGALDAAVVPAIVASLGLLVAHPSATLVAIALAVPVGLEAVLVGATLRSLRRVAVRVVVLGVGVVVVSAPWVGSGKSGIAVPASGAPNPSGTAHDAVQSVLRVGSAWTPTQPVLGLLVAVGVVAVLLRRRGISLLVGYVAFAVLFTAAFAAQSWADRLTAPFYGGWYRLLAVVGMLVPVLAAVGLDALGTAAGWLSRRGSLWRPVVAVVAVVGVLGVGLESARAVMRGESTVHTAWHLNLVTDQDLELFDVLAANVPPGGGVLNQWQDGSTWMYATRGVRPAIPYDNTTGMIPEWRDLLRAASIEQHPELCRLLVTEHVTHALAKAVVTGNGDNAFARELTQAAPGFYAPIASNPAGTVYEISAPRLAACAART